MKQFVKDCIKYIGVTGVVLSSVFMIGFFVGRARPPEIKTILMEDKADREYIERYNIAGEDGYQYVLHKEYLLDAEFVVPF